MKKILLVGKLNSVVKETNTFLSQYFHVQLCSENAGVMEGMMKIEEVDKLVEPLGWGRDLCHNGDCFPELNENTLGHEGSYKKFNMTEHGEDG